jgi:excisionase family DNA binding protein
MEAYSINEVIRRTTLCRDSVYKAINEGRLVARKAGKRTLVTAEDLNAFLKALPAFKDAA